MALIEWRKEFETGISGVDYEHEELITLINSVYEMIDQDSDKDSVVAGLGDIYGAISSHFALEERWMEEHEYDHYRQHREDHERLLDEIGHITDESEATDGFDGEQLKEKLNSWFLGHFQTHDARLHRIEKLHTHPTYEPEPSVEQRKPIAIWLLACCVTIFGMIVLGGVTRLTGSGLSMVQWAPIMGILPPIGQAEWEEVFLLYQQFPEYQVKNFSMTLDDFKSIFWFEYAHRLLGRTIGIIFLLPFLYFLIKGQIHKSLTPKLVIMFVLGGLQGLMGWYMVKSGLVNDPHVSQYRLTAHLGLAIVIYGYMFWVAMGLLIPTNEVLNNDDERKLSRFSTITSVFIFITALSGGFVAGTRAGFAFNTFPLMDGKLIPDGLFELSPLWRNFFENIVTVQFDHRLMATVIVIMISMLWFKARPLVTDPPARVGLMLLFVAMILQVTLGISTLLLVVPVSLAAAHQAGAVILLTASLFVTHQLRGKAINV